MRIYKKGLPSWVKNPRPMNDKYRQRVKDGVNLLHISQTRNYNDPVVLDIKQEKRNNMKLYVKPVVRKNVIKFTGSMGENPFFKLAKHIELTTQDQEYTKVKL